MRGTRKKALRRELIALLGFERVPTGENHKGRVLALLEQTIADARSFEDVDGMLLIIQMKEGSQIACIGIPSTMVSCIVTLGESVQQALGAAGAIGSMN